MAEKSALVAKAEAIERRYGYSSARFAREVLGISPAYWCQLKGGERRGTGGLFVARLLGRFPELAISLPSEFGVDNGNTERNGPRTAA